MKNRWIAVSINAVATIAITILFIVNFFRGFSKDSYFLVFELLFLVLTICFFTLNILAAIRKDQLFGVVGNLIFDLILVLYVVAFLWYAVIFIIPIMIFNIIDFYIYCKNKQKDKNVESEK